METQFLKYLSQINFRSEGKYEALCDIQAGDKFPLMSRGSEVSQRGQIHSLDLFSIDYNLEFKQLNSNITERDIFQSMFYKMAKLIFNKLH